MNFISYPLTVYAFHGCDREIAEAVLSGRQELKASENRWDWLGSGVYFWENAPERAYQWAVDMGKRNPAVVGAVVQLGTCLNLMESFPLVRKELRGPYSHRPSKRENVSLCDGDMEYWVAD